MDVGKFWFHEDLMIFLSEKTKDGWFELNVKSHETVKHLIESLGVPHTEVDVILVNDTSVDFSYRPKNGDKIKVFPEIKDREDKPFLQLQSRYDEEPRFVLDGHLGKLATYLRLLGFDARYKNEISDDVLVKIAVEEKRIILTRDRGLLMRSNVKHGYFVRGTEPKEQVIEILNRFDLRRNAKPFSRCANCNGLLMPVSKDEVYDRLEPRTKLFYEVFRMCSGCDQIYWRGSHFNRMSKFVAGLLEE